jgi:NDP-sugar pyrophosphorylase family protein
MQIIVPMSGFGNRFKAVGYQKPKPLIEVDGKTIIEHVIRMFPGCTDFKFICNEDHLATTDMSKILGKACPTGKIIPIESHKLGPVYAVLCAQSEINDDRPTIVTYCDYFASWDIAKFRKQVVDANYDGSVLCYKGFHPHLLLPNYYAGCRVDDQMQLQEIREKHSFTENKMDTWQSSGTYYFGSGKIVKKYFGALMESGQSVNNEYYVSMVYNLLIKDRLKVNIFEQPYFCQWGTPEDLEIYQAWSDYFAGLVGKPFRHDLHQKFATT